MGRISTQGLINSLRKCAKGQNCKWCAYEDTANCMEKLMNAAAKRMEELQTQKEKTKCKD